jgi:hypothetical protein
MSGWSEVREACVESWGRGVVWCVGSRAVSATVSIPLASGFTVSYLVTTYGTVLRYHVRVRVRGTRHVLRRRRYELRRTMYNV